MPRVSQMLESKYMKKEDVTEEGVVMTVQGVARKNIAMDDQPPEHKWLIKFVEFEKPMVLNATNIQLLERICGSDDTDHWKGKRVVVYSDPNVQFQGKLIGGLRVKAPQGRAPARTASDDDWGQPAVPSGTRPRPIGDISDMDDDIPF